jgi:ADP-ribosyl-[dinitrogen reductase] hydrolase
MHSTQQRRDGIEGMITGVAVGDALGYPRQGLTRRQAIKAFGPGPTRYGFYRNVGVTGFNTAHVLMTAQSIVSSGTDLDRFGQNLLKRLAWYAVSFPSDMAAPSRLAGLQMWLRWIRQPRPSDSLSNEPAVRSLLLVHALHNTNLSARDWIGYSVELIHNQSLVMEGCHLLGSLTRLIISERGSLNPLAAAKYFADLKLSSDFSSRIKLLPEFLEKGCRSSAVARHFGWTNGIPPLIIPTVIMSIYCFLRHRQDFRKAVDAVIRLGGDTSTTGAIVGGLSGGLWGIKKIPRQLVSQLWESGYNPTWIEQMTHRLAEWPHGADDLLEAPALPADPLSVVRGNLYRRYKRLSQLAWRIPCKLNSSPSARVRKTSAS